MIDLRLGRWQDVLVDGLDPIACDALIGDLPYGARVHDSDPGDRNDGSDAAGLAPEYAAMTPELVRDYVRSWSPVVRGWFAIMTSHDLVPAWEAAFAEVDRQCFAPIPCIMPGMSFRKQGDGPRQESVSLICARPRGRKWIGWGSPPGYYITKKSLEAGGGRGKPIDMMSAIVRDYSRKGDLVVDTHAGWGTTAVAAESLGRDFIGAEVDAAAHKEARRRIARGIQSDLFA